MLYESKTGLSVDLSASAALMARRTRRMTSLPDGPNPSLWVTQLSANGREWRHLSPCDTPLRNGMSPWKQQPTATGTRFSAIIWPSSRSRTQTATQCWPPPSTGESLLEVPRKPRSSRSRDAFWPISYYNGKLAPKTPTGTDFPRNRRTAREAFIAAAEGREQWRRWILRGSC